VAAKLVPLVLSLALTGCIVSLRPLYRDGDVVFEPALVGTWKPADANETWACAADDHGGYRVAYTDEKQRKGEFSVHLVAFGGQRFP